MSKGTKLDMDSKQRQTRSVGLLANEGISDSRKCANVLAAIALDVGLQRLTPQIGNTMCNAIGKLLKVKELEIKYGTSVDGPDGTPGVKTLALTD